MLNLLCSTIPDLKRPSTSWPSRHPIRGGDAIQCNKSNSRRRREMWFVKFCDFWRLDLKMSVFLFLPLRCNSTVTAEWSLYWASPFKKVFSIQFLCSYFFILFYVLLSYFFLFYLIFSFFYLYKFLFIFIFLIFKCPCVSKC